METQRMVYGGAPLELHHAEEGWSFSSGTCLMHQGASVVA